MFGRIIRIDLEGEGNGRRGEIVRSKEKEPAETTQSFWLRLDLILSNLEGNSTILSSELLPMRALKSLRLSLH